MENRGKKCRLVCYYHLGGGDTWQNMPSPALRRKKQINQCRAKGWQHITLIQMSTTLSGGIV